MKYTQTSSFAHGVNVNTLRNIPESMMAHSATLSLQTNSSKVTWSSQHQPTHSVQYKPFGKVAAASQSTKGLGRGVGWINHELMFSQIHNLATQAFLKPFRMRVYVFFNFSLRRSAPFAGYSLGEFRVRWSRFDAIADRECLINMNEFKNQN